MDDRTRMFLSALPLGAILLGAGCGYNQQSRFQMSFLPPAPHPAEAAAAEITPPPVVVPNPYLQQAPPINLTTFPPRHKLMGDAKVRQAEEAFRRGGALYKKNDTAGARREFDLAIDLMLDAADSTDDRDDYDDRLDEMVDAIHHMDLTGLGASADVDPGKFEKAPLEDILEMTFPVDPKLKDRVREQVAATVSQLPLSYNDTVLGYINYFSNRGHRTILAAEQRSGRYRPMIQRILDEEGVPQELIHLAQAESGFIPRAMSRKAAGGMWQFLAWRGQQYGLARTAYIDERMDPERATRAAARHLHDLYLAFGDWYLAIAAYNCGPGVVEKAVERTGYADFWDLRNRGVLPAETTNYVPIILAMTIMEKNAAEYGLDNITYDAPVEYDSVEMTAPTSLALVADILDTPMPELTSLNPAILKTMVPGGYSLHVPKGEGKHLITALELVPAEHRDSWRMHRVVAGETLASIGKRYGISPASIISANSLRTSDAVEGDRLLVPAALRAPQPVRKATASRSGTRRSASRKGTRKPAVVSSVGQRTRGVTLAQNSTR
jgi:membrane-bound lytic murein transglycosylase D